VEGEIDGRGRGCGQSRIEVRGGKAEDVAYGY